MSGHCPELSSHYWLSPRFPLHVLFTFARMSWSCPSIPFNSPFTSLSFSSFSRYVRFIFHACPALSLRVSSLHLPSCRLAALSFLSLSFPLHSPCFHFCPFHVPFSSQCFPFISRCFPVMSTSYFFPSLPCTSLHFPCAPSISRKKTRSFQRFRKEGVQKHRVFSRFSAKGERAGRGIRTWDPCLATPAPRRLSFSGTSSNYRTVRGGPPPWYQTYQTSAGGGAGAGPLSPLRCPTRRDMSADYEVVF